MVREKQELQDVKRELQAATEQVPSLQAKHDRLTGELESLQAATATAKLDKKEALALMAADRISASDMEFTRASCVKAEKAEKDAAELLEAVVDSLDKASGRIPELHKKCSQAVGLMWGAVRDSLKADIVSVGLDEKVWMLYIAMEEAASFSGQRWRINFRSLLAEMFPDIRLDSTGKEPVPNPDLRDKIRKAFGF